MGIHSGVYLNVITIKFHFYFICIKRISLGLINQFQGIDRSRLRSSGTGADRSYVCEYEHISYT